MEGEHGGRGLGRWRQSIEPQARAKDSKETAYTRRMETASLETERRNAKERTSTLEIPSNEIPFNERSLIRARYRSLQRAADQPLFPHYYGIKRARI